MLRLAELGWAGPGLGLHLGRVETGMEELTAGVALWLFGTATQERMESSIELAVSARHCYAALAIAVLPLLHLGS